MGKVVKVLLAVVALLVAAALGVGTHYSGKQTVQQETALAVEPEKAWELLTAFERLPELGAGVESVSLPEGKKPGPGYEFTMATEYGEVTARILEWKEGERGSAAVTLKGTELGTVEARIGPDGAGGTNLTLTTHLETKPPFGGLVALPAMKTLEVALERGARQLQERLEASDMPE